MNKVCIIAEAGVNHNGDINVAKKLVDVAKEAGADIVKFQTFNVDAITSKFAGMAEYQKKNIGLIKSQKEMLSELTLTHSEFIEIAKYCKSKQITFLSTPFDIEFLEQLGGTLWKIPSGEITNYPYLKKIAMTHKNIILSTGMSTLDEVSDAINLLEKNGAGEIILLHCTTQYPTPYEEVNLRAMHTLHTKFGKSFGYSDHTEGIEVAIAAAALGAVVIEKHFTLDRGMEGPDHKASIEFNDLKKMVNSIRNIEKALGSTKKEVTSSEIANISIVRKSIVASKDIKKGELFSEDNLTTKRPGTGISPMKWDDLIGKPANRNYKMDDLIIN